MRWHGHIASRVTARWARLCCKERVTLGGQKSNFPFSETTSQRGWQDMAINVRRRPNNRKQTISLVVLAVITLRHTLSHTLGPMLNLNFKTAADGRVWQSPSGGPGLVAPFNEQNDLYNCSTTTTTLNILVNTAKSGLPGATLGPANEPCTIQRTQK